LHECEKDVQNILSLLGFRKDEMRSFCWANAFISPLLLGLLLMVLISGLEYILANTPLNLPEKIAAWYPSLVLNMAYQFFPF